MGPGRCEHTYCTESGVYGAKIPTPGVDERTLFMTEILIGIITLGSLVALQAGLRHRTQRKLAKAWKRAQVELARNNYGEAELQLAECIRLVPLWVPARFLLGAVLVNQGKLEPAEDQLKMAQALQPRDATGFVELGIFYVTAANRIDEGIANFREALRLEPETLRTLQSDPRLASFRKSEAFLALERA
jgi:tetratricopeptide (TPR) repeat protein